MLKIKNIIKYFFVACLGTLIIVPTILAAEKWYTKPEITLKFANANPIAVNTCKAGVYFSERVAELTNGRIKVEYYHSGALGMNERVFAEQLAAGTLDLSHLASASFSTMVPALGVLSLGYVTQNPAHWYRLISSPIGKFLENEAEKKDVKILNWYCCAMRSIFLRKKPINTLEDLEGVKIRTMEDKMQMETFKALGAKPVPLAYGEVYTALQTGVIDAAENHPTVYIGGKYYEVAPYYSLTEHMGCPCLVAMSLKTWRKLDKEAQSSVLRAAQEEMGWIRGYNVYDFEKNYKWLKDKGIKVNRVDKDKFLEKLKPLHEKYIPTLIGKDLYEVYKSIPVTPELVWTERVYLYSE